MGQVKAIPDGYPRVTPYLIVDGAAAAIAFYTQVFGASERLRMTGPDGRLGHAELQIGDSVIMLADEFPERDIRGPTAQGGSPVSLHLYVEKVDAVVAHAVASGAILVRPVADQFYGDRLGVITDPFGHTWSVASHIRDVSEEEMREQAEKLAGEGA